MAQEQGHHPTQELRRSLRRALHAERRPGRMAAAVRSAGVPDAQSRSFTYL